MNLSNVNISGRYRGLVISITLFLALISALLVYTFYTSSLLEENTAAIDTSNQIANNAQAVIKDIFDLQNSYGEDINSPHIQTVLQRLEENSEEIDTLLVALKTGSAYVDTKGETVQLPSITDPTTLQALNNTEKEWSMLRPRVKDYLEIADDVRQDTSVRLALVGEQAKTSSLAMNSSLEELTANIFTVAANQARNIRLIQILGVASIFAYFLIFIFFFVRRLRESDAETLEARRETQEIMQTVSTGLFLLDKNLQIGQQHSQALESIIGSDRLAGENLTHVLRGRISDKDLDTTRQFIEQLYNPRVKEKLVNDLNPLHKVMLHTESESGQENRYLDFKFSRVYENKNIARILVNVTDVSDAVRLEQKLEQERAQNDMQIEMLTTILNVNPVVIQDFIKNTKQHIEKINNVLKNPGSSQFELENKLKLIFREMHSLKGESSALKLHSFTKIANAAEDKLQALQNQAKLSGNDFLPLAVDLEELLNLSNTIERLGERINQAAPQVFTSLQENEPTKRSEPTKISEPTKLSKTVAPTKEAVTTANIQQQENAAAETSVITTPVNEPKVIITEHTQDTIETENDGLINIIDSNSLLASNSSKEHDLVEYYQDFAQQIAQRQNKKIQLEISDLDLLNVSSNAVSTAKEVIIQLLRNAIVHGIEVPEVRQAVGKDETGKICLNVNRTDKCLFVIIEDDGAGIDYEKIRQKLIDAGKYDAETAYKLNQKQLLGVLFSSGFTTKSQADEDGGRGVGLDIVKDRIQESKGQLNIKSQLGEMTKFVITLPIES
ncbi:ATP-binding protein [Psychrobacter sp. I-STPA10]|uniref:ATP-binding protein n=1 Tax=Psychrobacter sp. I-STPA10 TaxID=2585769 RepID=UPI001E549BE0|nr:ATP-binding protein [Psychrobacter sp. I-STPA10]